MQGTAAHESCTGQHNNTPLALHLEDVVLDGRGSLEGAEHQDVLRGGFLPNQAEAALNTPLVQDRLGLEPAQGMLGQYV